MKTKFLQRVLWLMIPLLTIFTTNAWGAEAVYKTAKFGSAATDCGNCNQYNSSTAWTSTYNGFAVSVLHGSNNNCGWANVRFGSKTIDGSLTGTIVTGSIDKKVTKVSINLTNNNSSKTTSIKLYTSTNGSSWTERGTFTKSSGTQSVTIASANQAANLYYKIEVITTKGSANGFVQISQVDYYVETFTMTYNANGGSGTLSDANSPYFNGSTVTVKGNTFTRSGYTFDHWDTKSDDSGTDYAAGNTFTISANTTLYAQWVSAGTSVSLTKAGETNGTISLSPAGPLTTTSSSASTTVTASPSAGYYLSNLTASNPSTGTATVTGSGNTRTVTYTQGANGSSTITATFSPIWQLRGTFNSYDDSNPLTTIADGVASTTVTLAKNTRYLFQFYDASQSSDAARYHGNNGCIVEDISGWTFATGSPSPDCKIFTGPAGSYTFKINLSTKAVQVIYPEVAHPADCYVYFKKWADWNNNYFVHWWGASDLTGYNNAIRVTKTYTTCGTDYVYFPILTDYTNFIVKDAASGDGSHKTGDLSSNSNGAKYYDFEGWKNFSTYTISFNSGGGSGTMTAISDLCPGADQAITTNSFTRSNYTFTGWTANVDVKIGGSTVTAGTLIANGATIQDIQSNITLTAQWIQTPVITRNPSVIAFGSKKIDGSYTESFTVSGSNLASSSGLTLAVMGSNTGMYSIDKTEIAQTSAGTVASTTVTVTYHPTTAGSHAGADVRITTSNGVGGTITVSVTLSGTGVYEDTFIDMLQNTTGYTEGSPHTEQGAYGTTPSLSDKSVATSGTCEQQHYHFVGWITAAKYAAGTAISDGDLQTPTTASNATYYAVWAKQAVGGGSTTKTWTFSAPESNLAYSTETSDTQDGLTWKYKAYYNTTAKPAMTGIQLNSCSSTRASYFYIPGYNSLPIESIEITASASVTFKVVSNQPTTSDSQSALVEASGTSATLDCSSLSPKIQSCYIKVTGSVQVQEVEVTYNSISYTDYKANCCTDWSTPTVSYSSSLAINASEAVTISSGTTHGAVTYESSDEDVLTVDADGTIHAVGAGTAHITATWAGDATYCEKSANSNDVTVSGIQVTGTTPVNFGQVYQNAAVANKTIYVTGLGLASPITPSLPVGSPFSFSPASLAKDCSGATLTISASTATLGTYNQTLTLTSGAFSATVTVKMEVIAKPSATFTDALHGLTEDKDGVSLSSYNLTAAQGTAVVFPTLANQTKSAGTCEGEYYIFVGWTEGDNNTDPQDNLVTSYTLANGDAKNYYAVWADASGSATYTKLTSSTFKTTPTKYVLGGEDNGTKYFLYTYSSTDADLSWGECSSSEAPLQFTLSGEAGTLVAQDASGNYLAESSAKKKFRMSSTSATVQLQDDGTIETEYFYLRYNHNSGSGGLRYYETESSEPAYFYEVSAGGTVHYRTSCCTNKVDAPVVTATTVTSTSITLTWPSDVKATGWQIEWNGAGGWVTPSGSCTHTVSGLTPNTTYTWRVRATYEDPVCGADVRSGSTTTNQVYHVTYLGGSGTGSCSPSSSTTDATGYEAGATVTLQSNGFSLSGHTFNAWTTDDPDVTISSNQFTMPDHDVVITASWTAKMDKYFDRMHDQTDALHGGVEETEGTNEGKYYIPKEGCSYSVPTAVDSKTGDACQTSHYKLRGWIAASYVNSKGEITDESKIFSPGTTKTAGGYTYYAVWAEVVE